MKNIIVSRSAKTAQAEKVNIPVEDFDTGFLGNVVHISSTMHS